MTALPGDNGEELAFAAIRTPPAEMSVHQPECSGAMLDEKASMTTRQDTGTTSLAKSVHVADDTTVSYAYEHFDRKRQLRQLLLRSLLRWLITVVACVSIYGVLISYSSKYALLRSKKGEFNALIIALTITLGLNIASSFKANAIELQWWLLSLRRYSPREADLIMSSGHFTTMIKLGCITRHTIIRAFVTVFVALNIASQIALALLGITYNINPADKFTITRPGNVSIPDLSDIQGSKVLSSDNKHLNLTEDINSRRYSSNIFGQIGQGFSWAPVEKMPAPGVLYNPDLPQVYSSMTLPFMDASSDSNDHEDDQDFTWTYVFFETTVANSSYDGTVASNRSVSVTSSCESYHVVAGGNGMSSNITVRMPDGDEVVYLPVANGLSQILYLNDPSIDTNDTWSQVSVFEPSNADPWLYICQVSVGNVTNAVIKEHNLGANFTRYVPPAIALQGYGSSVYGIDNVTTNYQFQSYPTQSYFGQPFFGDGLSMAAQVGRCAINAVAACAFSNSNVVARGMAPQRGIVLEIVSWTNVHIILGLTMGVQLLVHLFAVFIANRVQVREQRSLATATLMRPLIAGVGPRASMARSKQIAKLIGKNVTVRYEPVGAAYDLCVYQDGERRRFTPDTLDG